MTNDEKLINALSMCRKAGKLVLGFDAVENACVKGTAYIVLTASDASQGTKKRVEYFCEQLNAPHYVMPLTQVQLMQAAKKQTAVFAVVDEHLANLCMQYLRVEK